MAKRSLLSELPSYNKKQERNGNNTKTIYELLNITDVPAQCNISIKGMDEP